MKGWLFTGIGEPLQFVEKADPTPGVGQVIVDIKASGLCLTDIHIMEEEIYKALVRPPMYLGHECAGIVSAVGEGVEGIKVGDRVAVDHTIDAAAHTCLGISHDGGYATKVLAQDYQCVLMPDEVTFAEAASATCAGLTAYHAVFTKAGAKPGCKIGFIGIGGIGQYAVGMAAAVGCQVYAASRSEKGKNIATSLGAYKVASSITEFADENLDIIVDLAGNNKTINDAIHTVKYGGTVAVVGMMVKDIIIENASAMDSIILKEVNVVGSSGGVAEEIKGIFDILKTGKYRPKLAEIPFEEIDKGLDLLREGKVEGKMVAVQP